MKMSLTPRESNNSRVSLTTSQHTVMHSQSCGPICSIISARLLLTRRLCNEKRLVFLGCRLAVDARMARRSHLSSSTRELRSARP